MLSNLKYDLILRHKFGKVLAGASYNKATQAFDRIQFPVSPAIKIATSLRVMLEIAEDKFSDEYF